MANTQVYDVLLPIFELSIGTDSEPRRPTRGGEKFSHDIGEGLYFPDFIRKDTKRDLLSLSLVCKAWSIPARQVLLRHVHIRGMRQLTALTAFLESNPSTCSLIRSVNIRAIPWSQDEEMVANRAWIILRSCSNITHAKLPDSASPILALEPIPFQNLLEFHSSSCMGEHGSGSHKETMFQFLRTLPSLQRLALMSLGAIAAPVDHIPFAQFCLESLAIEDDMGNGFRDFQWLLHSSAKSFKSLFLHWVNSTPDLNVALQQCGAFVQHLYLNGSGDSVSISSIISLCPNLRSLKLSKQDYLDDLSEQLSHCVRPLEHFHINYYTSYSSSEGSHRSLAMRDEVRLLAKLVKRHPALKELRKLCLGASVEAAKKSLGQKDIASLRAVCSSKNIVFNTLDDQDLVNDSDPNGDDSSGTDNSDW